MKTREQIERERYNALAPVVLKGLASRHMDGYYFETKEEALEQIFKLIPEGESVAWGGSMTLQGMDVPRLLKERAYACIDRDTATDAKERNRLMREVFSCHTYLSSVNAMSEDGVFINIDGLGNRVAAITFGPEQVILVVGMNKIAKTEADALVRARTYASPMNTFRLDIKETACEATGGCRDCKSPNSICSYIVTTRHNRIPGRIKVILVGESLGY